MQEVANTFSDISIADIASSIIALCALIFAIWQGLKQRKHDRLSVKPHIDIFEERHHLNNNVSFFLELQNNGLGPAIIKSHKVYKREDEDDEFVEVEDFENELKKVFEIESIDTTEWHKDVGLSANTKHKYLAFNIKSNDAEAREQVRTTMYLRYKIEIEYESMYGESFHFSTTPYTEGRTFLTDRPLDKNN
ncbi:hypothetical protein SKP08_002709 [Vibrio fluvialis]|uniref:hypothetical protein n=1 Tax=Vibrio fluvialis TaxID=676 RepID=UPI00130229A3|nr:hypothetical protein [Vibrio fluvialis]EKO3514171.1 hypothetical protein [Vibrio fluvialis]ELX7502629.1 hypothetical protein [Vibrio fluvialis]